MAKDKEPKAPASADALVAKAIQTAATKPKAKWSGASGAVLFSTKEPNADAAITAATTGSEPLLAQDGGGGKLTAAGIARFVELTPLAKVAAAVVTYAGTLAEGDRARLNTALESRTSGSEAERFTTALLALEQDAARLATEVRERAERLRLERYRQVIVLKRQSAAELEREAATLRAEIKGLEATVRELESVVVSETEAEPKREKRPLANEDKAFQRATADQLAASWRAAFDGNKAEGLEFIESAIWNIAGMKQKGEVGASAAFEPQYHECPTPVSTGASVTVVRPGWVLEESSGDYVPLKVLVKRT